MGSGSWPFKLMRKYQFEHWWFVGMLVGLIIMPWSITLLGCQHTLQSLRHIPISAVLLGNMFAVGWGIANVLCGLCLVRIGVALDRCDLGGTWCFGWGYYATGVQRAPDCSKTHAPNLFSTAGLTICTGVAMMLVGVIFASLAGLGQHREFKKQERPQGNYFFWLALTVVAGILSSFMTFVFVYSQDPIVANLSYVQPGDEIKINIDGHSKMSGNYIVGTDGTIDIAHLGIVPVAEDSAWNAASRIAQKAKVTKSSVRVETGSIPATFGVFALGLLGGAVINLGYAGYLLTKKRSWGLLIRHPSELALAVIIGVNFSLAVALMGKGMLLLGALGGSIGWGIQQSMQMTGSQLVGFISGEWRGIYGKPRRQMILAIMILIVAAIVLAYGNTLT